MASIMAFADVISANTEGHIAWFQGKGLLAQRKTCPVCSSAMNLQKRSDVTDKYRYSTLKQMEKLD